MKNLVFVAICLAMSCNSSQKTVTENKKGTSSIDPSVTFANTITEDELKEHLFTYASDEFEGRETGTQGQKKAAEYLKNEYVKLGIAAAKSDGDYFQKVPLEKENVPTGSITIDGKEFLIGDDFVSFSKAKGNFNEIVYIGYGIEEGDYSDYNGIDVTGKIVFAKSGEPKNENGTYLLSGDYSTSVWSSMSDAIGKRTELARKKGARALLFLDQENYPRFKAYFNSKQNTRNEQLVLKKSESDIFSIILTEKMAEEIRNDLSVSNKPSVITKKISFNLISDTDDIDSENVVAFIKGTEKPNEYLIISSHLDHIGVTADGQINNGADDDGSGSVALLEIAEAFKEASSNGHGPKRSVVFLHVTGEEKGLLGSQYYTDIDPLFPLANTVANLNIDMIGRIDPKRDGERNYIYLIGSDKLSLDLHTLSEEINNKYMNIELDYTFNDENDPNRFYYRSDHYNFAKNNIPIIFYFNGTHADYHRPGDTADKINYDLLQNRTRLIFHTAWAVANRTDRIVVDGSTK